jgi:hypothetical protein
MMKSQLLFLFSIVSLVVPAQKVTLDINQAYIPIITQKGDTLISSALTGNQWLMNGALMDGKTNKELIVTESGEYIVVVADNTGCSSSSEPVLVVIDDVASVSASDFACAVYPNPGDGLFQVSIDSDQNSAIRMKLISVDGKTVFKQKSIHSPGKQVLQFGKTGIPTGTYTLQIDFGTKTFTRKVIVK